ncbi:TPA_asm: P [Lonas gammacytorhabdovirus 1]|nr:TPA_asm: P [Lonas gammacytorhabdovirus 1]
MAKDAENTQKVKEQLQQNLLLANKKGNHPQYSGLPPFLKDPTSPLTSGSSTAADIAKNVTGVAAAMEGSSSLSVKAHKALSREDIEREAHEVSIALGTVLDPAFVEDLYALSSSDDCEFGRRDIYYYLRGAAKSHHVSVTNKLNELMQSVNTVLNKNRATIQGYSDNNKSMLEKLSVIEYQMNAITPAVSSAITLEHENTRKAIKAMTVSPPIKPSVIPPHSTSAASTSATHSYPSRSELVEMCLKLKIPTKLAEKCATDFQGIVTWEEYRGVNEGTIDSDQFKKLIIEWKKKINKN